MVKYKCKNSKKSIKIKTKNYQRLLQQARSIGMKKKMLEIK